MLLSDTTREGVLRAVAEFDLLGRVEPIPFKYPRRIVIVDQLPKGATGKVLKARLVE